MKKSVWLTWERQTRNISMARLLSADYCEFQSKQNKLLRYLLLSYKTFAYLFKHKPDIIYYQNPSIVLGLCCVLYKKCCRQVQLVGDFHNIAFNQLPTFLYKINSFLCRSNNITLVSNQYLINSVEEMGGIGQIFPDPIPEAECSPHFHSHANFILLVCSWAEDEPVNSVIEAFEMTKLHHSGTCLYITGRKKKGVLVKDDDYYENNGIKFTGFVGEVEYWNFLRDAQLVIDLTTRQDCLVCGAYESLAVRTPVIVSNNQASMEYFGDFAEFTDNSVKDLAEKIVLLLEHYPAYKEKVDSQLDKYKLRDQVSKSKLYERLQ